MTSLKNLGEQLDKLINIDINSMGVINKLYPAIHEQIVNL